MIFSCSPRLLCSSITKKIKDFAVQKRVKDSDRGERTTMKDLSYVILDRLLLLTDHFLCPSLES